MEERTRLEREISLAFIILVSFGMLLGTVILLTKSARSESLDSKEKIQHTGACLEYGSKHYYDYWHKVGYSDIVCIRWEDNETSNDIQTNSNEDDLK